MHCENADAPDDWIAVTPSDTAAVDLVGLYVGGAGDVTVTTAKGAVTTFANVPAGGLIPGRFVQVRAAGTTATAIVGASITAPPVNSVAPSISGIQTAGQTLTVSNGAWSQPVTSYAFQWKRNGTDIAGATAQTYVLQAGDAGQAISCTVTATNSAGSGSATSASVTPAVVPIIVLASNSVMDVEVWHNVYTDTATAGATEGGLAAFINSSASDMTGFSDSTGAEWTRVMSGRNHAAMTIYKRMVGDHPIVAGETTFSVANQYGDGQVQLYIVNVPDATGMPTTADAAQVGSANDGVLGGGAGDSVVIPAASNADSYQLAAFNTSYSDASIPDFGSDDSWVQLAKMQADPTNNGTTTCLAYRKGGDIGPTALAFAVGAYSYRDLGWCEFTAPPGGATSNSGAPVGGGGGAGTVSDLNDLVSKLNAGVAANGGKTFTLPADTDLGGLDLVGKNFASNPVTFVGQAGTKFEYLHLSNCHGIIFKDCLVYGDDGTGGIHIDNGCTSLTFDGVECNTGDAVGAQTGSTGIYVRNTMEVVNANLQFIGKADNSSPDIYGYANGIMVLESDGGLIKDMTITNIGVDGIDLYGVRNYTVDHCLGHDFFSNIAGGDHPDWIQWAGPYGPRSTNLTIKNCGFFVGGGAEPQGYFGGECDTVTVTGCWMFGGIYNTYSASDCTNVTFSDVFGQGDDTYGSRCMVRGGCDTVLMTKVVCGSTSAYTEPAQGGNPPIECTNVTIADDNVAIGNRPHDDYTDVDAWLATHPNARQRA
jgi:hypothetical protein